MRFSCSSHFFFLSFYFFFVFFLILWKRHYHRRSIVNAHRKRQDNKKERRKRERGEAVRIQCDLFSVSRDLRKSCDDLLKGEREEGGGELKSGKNRVFSRLFLSPAAPLLLQSAHLSLFFWGGVCMQETTSATLVRKKACVLFRYFKIHLYISPPSLSLSFAFSVRALSFLRSHTPLRSTHLPLSPLLSLPPSLSPSLSIYHQVPSTPFLFLSFFHFRVSVCARVCTPTLFHHFFYM